MQQRFLIQTFKIMANHPKYDLKSTSDEQFMFNLTASNGEIILTSERYTAKHSAMNGIESVKENAQKEERFEKLESSAGEPYFVLKAGNHEVIGRSEMYSSNQACQNGIESVMKNAPIAEVEDNAS